MRYLSRYQWGGLQGMGSQIVTFISLITHSDLSLRSSAHRRLSLLLRMGPSRAAI
jgi:F0F1-type ATP synthase alpha subunit